MLAIEDLYPVAPGHMLVLPKRHAQDYFSMTEAERVATNELLRVLRNRIIEERLRRRGFQTSDGTAVPLRARRSHTLTYTSFRDVLAT